MRSDALPAVALTDRPLRIVALGDSTTAGTPAYLSPVEAPPEGRGDLESQYAYWMEQAHPMWSVLNRGVNGERSDEILARVRRDVLASRPDYLIVLAGVNDIYQGRSVASVQSNLASVYQESAMPPGRLVAATILPYNSMSRRAADAIRSINEWIAHRADEAGYLFCDTNAAVRDPGDPNRLGGSPDGLHPDVPGYRRMGEALAQVIQVAELGREP
jgi:lysophospholipase L1-like esterase